MVENPPASTGRGGKRRCDPWVGKSLWGRALATHSRIPGTSLMAQSVRNLQCGRHGFNPRVRKIPWRREWQPTPVFFPREFHGQKSVADYSPWGCQGLGTTEQLTLTFREKSVKGGIRNVCV